MDNNNPCPICRNTSTKILNVLNLEWLWRLRFDTLRRIVRLSETSYLFLKMLILNNNRIS